MCHPEMMAVYSYDYADRLTAVLHNTAQFPPLISLHLFHVVRKLMYKHATPCSSIGLFSPIESLSIFHQSPNPFPMHLFTPLRGSCIHARTALSRLVHHRLLPTVHLFLIVFAYTFLLTTPEIFLYHFLFYLSLPQLYNIAELRNKSLPSMLV
ncbi:hypothetical protein EDB87DRAFT_858082 [Lactarius vividus]|nr:hypothetical protein EDB87DRAFT_858082 [Lactarius vividus]